MQILPKKFNDFLMGASTSKEAMPTNLASDWSTIKKVPSVSLTPDPQTYEQAISCPEAIYWVQAMENEYFLILSNNT